MCQTLPDSGPGWRISLGPGRLLSLIGLSALLGLVLTVLLLLLMVPARADVPPSPHPSCWIRGTVFADPNPNEVGYQLARSPWCPAKLHPRREGHRLFLETEAWVAEIAIPEYGGNIRLDYRWGAPVASLGGREVPVYWGPVGGV